MKNRNKFNGIHYKLSPINGNGNLGYELYEKTTEQVIAHFKSFDLAKKTAIDMDVKHLAFAGWTPAFIVKTEFKHNIEKAA